MRSVATTTGRVRYEVALEHHGWVRARFEIGSARAELTGSYLRDGPGDLLLGLCVLRASPGTVRVTWAEEPGEFRWVFHRVGDDVTTRILWFDDWPTDLRDDDGTEVLVATCGVGTLIRGITAGTSRLLRDTDEEAYARRWGHSFPAGALADLSVEERRA
jgi:hypothetical protein